MKRPSMKAVDKYIKLEGQLEQATSRKVEEKLIRKLGSLEVVDGVTSEAVRARKKQLRARMES